MENVKNKNESGNVLFLILIAVALFAALSYAVTQSTRGGGNADDETSLISSASLTQYPASLKTNLLRMSISDGVGDTEIMFNPPSDQTACIAVNTDEGPCVFNADGGGASYQAAPSNVVTGSAPVDWVFNRENEIQDVGSTEGSDTPDIDSIEVIAFLSGVTNGVCSKINEELGIGDTIPAETGIDVATLLDDTTVADQTPAGGTIGEDVAVLDGQPFGCFSQGGANHYYHALSEN